MRKLLLILLYLPLMTLAQKTYVPDDNFEDYLETHTANGIVVTVGNPFSMGDGIANNDSVTTVNINTVTSLHIGFVIFISDLTGIEDFTALTNLYCWANQLTSLDVSQNTALTSLHCWGNQLTSLDVSQNTALTSLDCNTNQLTSLDVSQNTSLTSLDCEYNQLTSLDVSQNTALTSLQIVGNNLTTLDVSNNTDLTYLSCGINQLTSLDVSQNTDLTQLYCSYNQLTSLDLRNGSNLLLDSNFICRNNLNLTCISVDDSTWSTNNWTVAYFNIDPQHYFSNNCSGLSAIEDYTTNKKLLKVIDLLGREIKGKTNQPLFFIYDDGTVEKRIVLE